MLYVVSYPVLAKPDEERIEAYRLIHQPERARSVRAHVTLVFGVRSITIHDLSSRVALLAAETSPFEVIFDRPEQAESPGGIYNVFLLAGEGASTLRAMHRKLYSGQLSSELLLDAPFRAHMTVATSASGNLNESAMKDVPRIGLPVRGLIKALNILALENGKINDVKSICLKARETSARRNTCS